VADNVEWKAHSRDPQQQRELAERLADGPPELLEQADTFFPTPHGRLKLRQLAVDRGELIYYERPDEAGPKQSTYVLAATDQPEALSAILTRALGVRGVVRKRRWLYRVGQTRIHFDEVEGLGTFLEVEVVLQPGQTISEGERIAEDIRRQLAVRDEDLVGSAYIDLLMPG
jgi:predicted adenylyl cyclase CyaB